MDQITEEINRELEVEFIYGNGLSGKGYYLFLENREMLFEECGMIPNLYIYTDLFSKYVEEKFDEGKETFQIVDNIFETIPNLFFNNVLINVFQEEEVVKNGEYFQKDNNFDNENKKITTLFINLYYKKTNFYNDINILTNTFAHELTHAYEDWERQYNNAQRVKNTREGDLYNRLQLHSKDELIKILNLIYYFSFKTESQAYVGKFASELKAIIKKENCTNSDDFKKIVNEVPILVTYKTIKGNFDLIESALQDNSIEDLTKIFLRSFNSFTDSNYQAIDKPLKILHYRFYRAWNNFRKNVSKIAFKMFSDDISILI